MESQIKEGDTYPVESGNIASIKVENQKCYTDGFNRKVLVVEFKRGAAYRYWPATIHDLERGCKANEGRALAAWFNDIKTRKYEKIIE
jgi:hypothetical protein